MADRLELKSKVEKLYDYTKIDITEFIPEYAVDEELLQKDLKRILNAHGTKKEADEVLEGDMITLSCTSPLERLNKNNVMVMVGRGLFHKELELQLLGLKRNEKKKLMVSGETVEVEIHTITRTVLPVLKDEVVASFGMEDVKTVEDLKRYCIDKQIVRFLDGVENCELAASKLWRELSDNSSFLLDPEEEKRALDEAAKKEAELLTESEENVEEVLKPEDAQEESIEEMDMTEFVKMMYLNGLKFAAVGFEIAQKEGSLLTQADYEEYISRRMDYEQGSKREEVMEKYPVEEFLKDRYNDIVCDILDEYVLQSFLKEMNPLR